MRIRDSLVVAVLAAGIGGLIVPALAQDPNRVGHMPDQGMGQSEGMGHMGHGMMGGMMGGGCAGMMQSKNGGDGRPNSQWQTHRPGNAMPD